MGLLSYFNLVNLVNLRIVEANLSQINGASIDLTLAPIIRRERPTGWDIPFSQDPANIVDLARGENITTEEYAMEDAGYLLMPGEFVLASSNEKFNLPNTIAAEYSQKSSLARNGLNHCLAGHLDPGWYNSTLTLELFNVSRFHTLRLRPGMPIGQVKFFRVEEVPAHASYATKGQYNDQLVATASKGVR